jgi:cellulose synthase/poly-beta-1,6-N-acetylglucosamine synthase-like glycosyltransferase
MTGIRVQTVRPDDFARVTSVVVVPACNEENFIAACLSGLFAQSGTAPAGIVLAINNTSDDTADVALSLARRADWPMIVVEARYARGGVGRARRLGHAIALRAAPRAGVLLSTDADCRPDPDWQAEMEIALHDAPAVLGRIEVSEQELASFPSLFLLRQREETAFATLAMEFEQLMDPVGPGGIGLNTAGGANLGFQRGAYLAVGGYRSIPSGEDRDIIQRVRAAGLRPIRAETAVVCASMRTEGRAPGGMAEQIVARSAMADCSVDSALLPFDAMVSNHLGRPIATPRLTLSRARTDLPTLKRCVETLRALPGVDARRRHLAGLLPDDPRKRSD